MVNVLDLIRRPKTTVKDYDLALGQLSVEAAEAAVQQLEIERRRILIDGTDAQLTAIEQKIATANREVERVACAIEELNARREEAVARERADHIAFVGDVHKATWAKVKNAYLELDALLSKAAPLLDRIDDLNAEFRNQAMFLSASGRQDLELAHPLGMLLAKLNRQHGSIWDVDAIKIPGYRDPVHPDGLNFGKLRDVGL